MKIEFNVSQLRQFYDSLNSVNNEYSQFLKDFLLKQALMVLANTKSLTPVHTGDLRNRWELTSVKQTGMTYEVQIFNSLYYASYIEDGHRQRVGRFVPGYIDSSGYFQYQRNYPGGIILKKPFVNGFHMCRISLERIDSNMKSQFEIALKAFLKRNHIS